MFKFFLGSAVLHSIFVLLIFHSIEPNFKILNKPVEVSLVKNVTSPPSDSKRSSHRLSGIVSKMNFRKLSMKDFDVVSGTSNPYGHSGLVVSDPSRNWNLSKNYLSNDLSSFDELSMDEVRFEKVLWKEIDQSIEESQYLSEYNHTGKIHIQFEIDRNGQLIEASLRACGEDAVLKVYAMRALRKALLNENNEIKFLNINTKLFAQFSWSDYESCKSLRGINNKFLSFCHYAVNARKSFSAGERTATYLKALNSGFGAIEEIQKYNREQSHREELFNPFEKLKNDRDWNLGC
jgi:hypothetical protein